MTPWKVFFVALFLAVGGVLGYGGVDMIVAGHLRKSVMATIVSCEEPQATGHGNGDEVCEGTWTAIDPTSGHPRAVRGTVESATYADQGKTLEIVVAGGHGFSRSLASRLGYIALVFALLFLAIGISILVNPKAYG